MSDASIPATADLVRAKNQALDELLLAAIDESDPSSIHVDPGNGEWTLAQNLGHIGEFPRFFAAELLAWRSDRSRAIGRTHDHDRRNAAVESASRRDYEGLRDDCRGALVELAAALESLEDGDIEAVTTNVKYGQEPLRAYLGRYILGHKEGHVDQLQRTLAVVREQQAAYERS